MLNRIRRLPSPALVISWIALIVAVGGGSFALAITDNAKDKKIAKKAANKVVTARAPSLSVSHANTANSATTATSANHATTADTATTANGIAPPEPYHEVGAAGEPPFQNGWTNTGGNHSTAAFYKDRECVVHLKGTMQGAGGNVAFTLPSAYRPSQDLLAPAAAPALNVSFVDILSDGSVLPVGSDVATHSWGIDGLSFRAATC